MNAFDRLDKPAFDVRSLDALKRDARHAEPGALRAAAQQMEDLRADDDEEHARCHHQR